jgi:hypothetical protein
LDVPFTYKRSHIWLHLSVKQKRNGDATYYGDDSGNFFYKAFPYTFSNKKGAENNDNKV